MCSAAASAHSRRACSSTRPAHGATPCACCSRGTLSPGAPDPLPLLRPSRGVHLVYPRLTRGHGLLVTARTDGRVFFVVPFGSRSLVGTTEVELPSPPPAAAWRPSLDEVAYLRAELGRALPGAAHVPPIAILSALRPLLASDESVGEASREHAVIEEAGLPVHRRRQVHDVPA
jgi:glycerol-3-phosphate dehydrogenase